MAQVIRPYLVTDATGAKRLIQAPTQAQARNFVARHQYAVRLVSATEVISLLTHGITAELATDDEPAAAAATPAPLPGPIDEAAQAQPMPKPEPAKVYPWDVEEDAPVVAAEPVANPA